jgi:hypothetical protein
LPDAWRGAAAIGGSGTACRGAAACIRFESALATRSLPLSIKGYELYSWYLNEGDAWRYTLINGTKCDKSYAEISTPESVIKGHDRVKITVGGTDALRSVLDRFRRVTASPGMMQADWEEL